MKKTVKTKYGIIYRGERIELNPHIITQQKLSDNDIKLVLRAHKKRVRTFHKMEELDPILDNKELRELDKYALSVDEELQAAWKFDRDPTMNIWWFRVPHCTCSNMRNFRLLGELHKAINPTCPVHGLPL